MYDRGGPGDRPRRVRWRRRCRDRQGGRRWTATAPTCSPTAADSARRHPPPRPSPPSATSSSRTPRPASAAPWCAARRRRAGSRSPSRTGAAGTGSSPWARASSRRRAVQLVRPAVAAPAVARRTASGSVAVSGSARGWRGRAGSTSRASTTPSSSRRSGATTCASTASWSSTWAASTTCRPWSATSAPRRSAGSACWSTISSRAARSRGSRPRCGPARAGPRPPLRRRLAGRPAGGAGHHRLARGAARDTVEGGRLRRAGLAGRPAAQRGAGSSPR